MRTLSVNEARRRVRARHRVAAYARMFLLRHPSPFLRVTCEAQPFAEELTRLLASLSKLGRPVVLPIEAQLQLVEAVDGPAYFSTSHQVALPTTETLAAARAELDRIAPPLVELRPSSLAQAMLHRSFAIGDWHPPRPEGTHGRPPADEDLRAARLARVSEVSVDEARAALDGVPVVMREHAVGTLLRTRIAMRWALGALVLSPDEWAAVNEERGR